MGKARECFLCSMLLTELEREKVEATVHGKNPQAVEVCARCLDKVVGAGAVATAQGETTVVLRPRARQDELFPGASTERPAPCGGCG